MAPITDYHRPASIEAALDLLARSDVATSPLGGGTLLNAAAGDEEVVDLQALDLAVIAREGSLVRWGATTTLRDVVDHEATPPLLGDLARREAPNTIRNAATIGGLLATADPHSGLYAGMLVHRAEVTVATTSGSDTMPLEDLDAGLPPGSLITSVVFDPDGPGTSAGAGRTPADTPIVLVAGRRMEDGSVRLAATGVADRPVLLDGLEGLDPPGDFRGSSEYRRELAATLTDRVLARLATDGPA